MKQQFSNFLKKYPSDPIVKLVYKFLYWEIISLYLPPGTKINMAKLADELDVNRSTVRDAILMLVNENLVYTGQNQGYYVSYLNIKEMNDLYTVRKYIETGAARLLCEIITPAEIEGFQENLSKMENAVTTEDYMQFTSLDCSFHEMIVNCCKNHFFIKFYEEIIDIIKRYISYTSYTAMNSDDDSLNITSTLLPLMLRHHKMMVNSLQLGQPDNLETIIESHFNGAIRLHLHPNYHIK